MENGWTKRIEELEESRNNWKREWSLLNAALNMAEDRIKELEAERDVDRRREYGYSQQTVDALTAERDKLEAENKRLRELVDGARVIVEVFQWSTPAQERWREEWLKKAAKALKEASHEYWRAR
jgi:chromosome segregation ATPase